MLADLDPELLDDLNPFDLIDAEAARLDRFFRTLADPAWVRPSRRAGWTVRDVLAHVAGLESYLEAWLDGDLNRFLLRLRRAGLFVPPMLPGPSLGDFSEWCVRQRRTRRVDDVLAEWREASHNSRRRLRALGRNRLMPAGGGPVGVHAFCYAAEYATHADDVGVPVGVIEDGERTRWRARVGRVKLAMESGIIVEESPSGYRVRLDELDAELTASDFVAATADRLPTDHSLNVRLRIALVCFT